MIKYKKENITWIEPIYLTKDISKDVAGFWVNTQSHKLYCARETEIGLAHYYFNEELKKWQLDYFCDKLEHWTEDTGIVINLKEFQIEIVNNVLYAVKEEKFLMNLSIEKTKKYIVDYLEMNINNIDFQYFAMYVRYHKPNVAYCGNYEFIVFEKVFIKK